MIGSSHTAELRNFTEDVGILVRLSETPNSLCRDSRIWSLCWAWTD